MNRRRRTTRSVRNDADLAGNLIALRGELMLRRVRDGEDLADEQQRREPKARALNNSSQVVDHLNVTFRFSDGSSLWMNGLFCKPMGLRFLTGWSKVPVHH